MVGFAVVAVEAVVEIDRGDIPVRIDLHVAEFFLAPVLVGNDAVDEGQVAVVGVDTDLARCRPFLADPLQVGIAGDVLPGDVSGQEQAGEPRLVLVDDRGAECFDHGFDLLDWRLRRSRRLGGGVAGQQAGEEEQQ